MVKKSKKPVKKKAKSLPHIAVIGAGPIGAILGAHLAKIKIQVTFVDILKDYLETIKKQGITVSGVVNFHTMVNKVTSSISELKKLPIDYIFLCVKTLALPKILPELKKVASARHSTVISFQNGLDVEDEIAAVIGKDRVLRAVVNYAGNIINDAQIRMAFFNSPNYLGGLNAAGKQRADEIAKILTSSGLDTKVVDDIRKHTWQKTILNAALAPVCAVMRLTMKQAMDNPQIEPLVEKLLQEGITVAKADGYDYGKKFFSESVDYLKKAGEHKPSMLMDIEKNSPTEIDFINGKITEIAKSKNIPVPYNDVFTSLVRGIQSS
ncbi:MAG: 2-dehydropantoate 2-reductase [Planctomycetes bacterium]|nr:2-dehydropantoate 2-reductase [Planctomycetota bacterium]